MFDLDQLRSFTILAAEKHFGRAAHRLFITQSALTRRIQQLEAELDVLLLNRSSRTVALTAAGETFLTHATAILSSSQEAVRAAREATGQPIGALSIGFDGATTYAFLPQLIARARDSFPALRLDFTEAGSQAQMTEVLFHRLDLGLVRPLPHDRALQMTCVRREDLALALPITHRLAGKRRPQLQDLEDEAFVGYSEAGSYLRDLIGGSWPMRASPRALSMKWAGLRRSSRWSARGRDWPSCPRIAAMPVSTMWCSAPCPCA
jgi:DNA-binding transcriptional LysR family regulator